MKIAKFKVISVVTMIIMILIIPTLIGIKATNTNKIINKYIVLGDAVSGPCSPKSRSSEMFL